MVIPTNMTGEAFGIECRPAGDRLDLVVRHDDRTIAHLAALALANVMTPIAADVGARAPAVGAESGPMHVDTGAPRGFAVVVGIAVDGPETITALRVRLVADRVTRTVLAAVRMNLHRYAP